MVVSTGDSSSSVTVARGGVMDRGDGQEAG